MNITHINPTRTQRIDQIIRKRKAFSAKLQRDKANLEARKLALVNLKKHREDLLARGIDSNSAVRLGEIDFSLLPKIDTLVASLQQLYNRSTRDTINIAVVGYARQGKSRLLRSLTGLKNTVIPDGGDGYCTGTLSKIRHEPGLPEAKAKVQFYSWQDFRGQVLSPYYETLGLETVPMSLDDFAQYPPSPLPIDRRDSAIDKARYGHLRKDYFSNVQKYRHLLGQSSVEIGEGQIREYVTQDTKDGSGEKIVNYLAVKEVEVSCPFPAEDIGKIMLIDLPGLGDTNLIDADRLMNTLHHEADFVLFVRRPEANAVWGEAHIKLYQKARDALGELPLHECSFMVLNRTQNGAEGGDNTYRCQTLQGELKQTPIRVERCAIADCSNPEEANSQILEPILNYLVDNIEYIDSKYAHSCQKQIDRLQKDIDGELAKAEKALAHYSDSDLLFEQLFEGFWQKLTNDLENLLTHFSHHRQDRDREFEERIQSAIANCRQDTGIPETPEEIIERRNLFGSYTTAYNEFLHEIRTHFLQHFLSLDMGMQDSIETRKILVSKVFANHLGELADGEGSQLLKAIATHLPENATTLKNAFGAIADFNVSGAGRIQRQIRENLNKLRPDNNFMSFAEVASDVLAVDAPQPTQEELILAALQKLHKEAADKAESALNTVICEPSIDAYYMVEEFVDRILRTQGVQLEWRIFLRKVSSQVWPEFKEMEKRLQQQQIWQLLVNRAKEVNELQDKQLMN
ncbi:MAG: dynamin family protein [Calothrix sp. MO_192.B10]|nr:dynamin family protein [Calothrix sp. MO_192.B10]